MESRLSPACCQDPSLQKFYYEHYLSHIDALRGGACVHYNTTLTSITPQQLQRYCTRLGLQSTGRKNTLVRIQQ